VSHGDAILPLTEFSEAERQEIERLAAAPTKPPRWMSLGFALIQSRAWYEWHRLRGIDPWARRDRVPAWVRAAVLERDGFVCQLCHGEVAREDVHLDHRIPYSHGGRSTVDNLQVTHSLCNLKKGARVGSP
jgi:hypothetical protein